MDESYLAAQVALKALTDIRQIKSDSALGLKTEDWVDTATFLTKTQVPRSYAPEKQVDTSIALLSKFINSHEKGEIPISLENLTTISEAFQLRPESTLQSSGNAWNQILTRSETLNNQPPVSAPPPHLPPIPTPNILPDILKNEIASRAQGLAINVGKTAFKKATKEVTKRLAKKGITTTVAAAAAPETAGLSLLIGAIVELGSKILSKIGDFLKKIIPTSFGKPKDWAYAGLGTIAFSLAVPILLPVGFGMLGYSFLTGGTGAVTGALSGIAGGIGTILGATISIVLVPIGISLIVIPLLLAFIILVITNSGYVIPPGTPIAGLNPGGGSYEDPGIPAGFSCPVPSGQIICGVYGGPYDSYCSGGHGSNTYWTGNPPACQWALPSLDANCYYNQKPGSVCYKEGASCPYYGYSSDVSYPDLKAGYVYLPYINGQPVAWSSTPVECISSGCGGVLTAHLDGNTYALYMMHLTTYPTGGVSGNRAGIICNGCAGTPHVHLEIRVNGVYTNPDRLCAP